MADPSAVSVVIPAFNEAEAIGSVVTALREAGPWHEIIVVDNASHDGSAPMVREEFARVLCIASSTNLGFAGGNNLAYRHARGTWIWLLNPDT